MIAVIDSFNGDNWVSVTIEPSEALSKVDINWEYTWGNRVVQVKSSKKSFSLPIAKKLCKELKISNAEASYYE